ncbi:MAG: 4-(cytidine 5'-diphospho)-2-C-methyl-D-erythritol kinase [Defluviitaleaceae bacterium]|nr:4-(cytidine 5'-diphospho)-2-C-methyl-D-erythritol kinase [Defluviitaleaceae bacterium]
MNKNFVTLKANAKINLALGVVSKRKDDYHNLKMVMQTLLLHDSIFIKKIDSSKIKINTNLPWLPTDEKNLVYKAVNVMQKKYKLSGGVYIEIVKNIPISAGLGGGSADCAATLISLRKLYNLNISMEELRDVGRSLGADVPYLLTQGTAFVEGTGDIITKLNPHPFVYIVLAKPKFNVSTEIVFKKLSKYPFIDNSKKINAMLTAIKNKNIYEISKNFFNDLEIVTATKYPIIYDIKRIMLENGAIGSIMSGSGPTVFGYFLTKKQAFNAIKILQKKGIKDIIFTGVFDRKKLKKQ